MSDSIPFDVLRTWLSPEAIARIDRYWSPDRRADQVDLELDQVGLMAVWAPGEDGPVMIEVRIKDPGSAFAADQGT